MIIAKKNPVGIDITVAQIQYYVNQAFNTAWDDGSNPGVGIICYPRCYVNAIKRNKTNVYYSKVIEHFDESNVDEGPDYFDTNVDYVGVLDGEDNKMIIVSDYDVTPEENSQHREMTTIECIFIVNLNKAYPNIKHRADEEARIDVKNVLEKIPNVKVYRTIRMLNKVFGDIKYSTSLDMHPLHCFKIVLDVNNINTSTSSPGGGVIVTDPNGNKICVKF